jgi:hypothetical protein
MGQSRLEQVEYLSGLYQDVFIIFMAHQPNPIVVSNPGEDILIGRFDGSGQTVTVDLEEFGGAQLGVSRRHAQMRRDVDGWNLIDYESKNGTWLNGMRVEAHIPHLVRSGDEIRLGHMTTHVYFNRAASRVQSLVLINQKYATDRLHSRLTHLDLMLDLGPFLQAFGDLQTVYNDAWYRSDAEINIAAIVTDKQGGTISVTVEGAMEALVILRQHIAPCRRDNRVTIEAGGEDLQAKQRELVLELVQHIRSGLDADIQERYVNRLDTIVDVFLNSSIELAIEQPVAET